ncbi:MAG: hypothetical protein GY838_10475 [bacterium]|nr:hypothetical protein [bacterium]
MKKLYIGNLPFTATEDEIRETFGAHNQVPIARRRPRRPHPQIGLKREPAALNDAQPKSTTEPPDLVFSTDSVTDVPIATPPGKQHSHFEMSEKTMQVHEGYRAEYARNRQVIKERWGLTMTVAAAGRSTNPSRPRWRDCRGRVRLPRRTP